MATQTQSDLLYCYYVEHCVRKWSLWSHSTPLSSSLFIKTIHSLPTHFLILVGNCPASLVSILLLILLRQQLNHVLCIYKNRSASLLFNILHSLSSFACSVIHSLCLIHFLTHRWFPVQVNTIPTSDSHRDQHAHHDLYCCRAFPGNPLSSACPQQLLTLSCLQDAGWVMEREIIKQLNLFVNSLLWCYNDLKYYFNFIVN